jgi:hypothetical protein
LQDNTTWAPHVCVYVCVCCCVWPWPPTPTSGQWRPGFVFAARSRCQVPQALPPTPGPSRPAPLPAAAAWAIVCAQKLLSTAAAPARAWFWPSELQDPAAITPFGFRQGASLSKWPDDHRLEIGSALCVSGVVIISTKGHTGPLYEELEATNSGDQRPKDIHTKEKPAPECITGIKGRSSEAKPAS